MSVHVVCELRAGAELSRKPLKEHEELDRLLAGLIVAYPDARFAPAYGRLLASIERTRSSRGLHGLCSSRRRRVLDDAPLLTRNTKDFSRVPGLRVLEYLGVTRRLRLTTRAALRLATRRYPALAAVAAGGGVDRPAESGERRARRPRAGKVG